MSHRKQFCPRHHDTFVTGRYPNGQCKPCGRMGKARKLLPVEEYERLPMAPLVAALAAHGISNGTLGRILGRSFERMFLRWKARGDIPVMSADRIACDVLALHPSEIWGADFFSPKPIKEAA